MSTIPLRSGLSSVPIVYNLHATTTNGDLNDYKVRKADGAQASLSKTVQSEGDHYQKNTYLILKTVKSLLYEMAKGTAQTMGASLQLQALL